MKKRILEAFHAGHSLEAYQILGAHFEYENGPGVRFSVYAPNARQVQLLGSFNQWSEPLLMERQSDGIWSLFVLNVSEWTLYKYRIEQAHGAWVEKSDPYAFYSELRPNNASLVVNLDNYDWHDYEWIHRRQKYFDQPMNIYELHLGSWRKRSFHEWMNYEEIAEKLIPYCKEMGFTHIELMPLTEYPFDGSWGYQAHGYFSLTSRYGGPKQFMRFVDLCHQNDIGVILDFVPVHFVKDNHGLRQFDGTALYEYQKEEDANSQWDTLNFDLWKEQVRSFLMSSASFWVDKYHVDGLRIDAVSNVIYWHGQKNRGQNEGALAFIRRLNYYMNVKYPGIIMMAEDSSDFPQVTHPTTEMGLGFDYKWDLGWMNDTLKYYSLDPIHRRHHHHQLTFSMAYFYSENFVLPLSHDEVVHGKGTIIQKMWGDYRQKFAQARNLYAYMFAHPGKKLNFMGNEIAHFREWDEAKEVDWFLCDYQAHEAFKRYFRDVSLIYRNHRSLSHYDYQGKGFSWIDADNTDQSIYSFIREDETEVMVCVLNMTPALYNHYRVAVPIEGKYTEILNSDNEIYDGDGNINPIPIQSEAIIMHQFEQSISFRLPSFGAIYFHLKK